jgi:hypothetical protein
MRTDVLHLLPQKNNTNTVVPSTKFNSFTMQSVNQFFHTLTLQAMLDDRTV